MEGKLKYLLLKTVQDNNILPLSSVCNLRCKFCSNRFNPPGVEVYNLGHLEMKLVRELVDYLPAEGPVIIGESATRISEGEPLTHPDFPDVIKLLREKFPDKKIKITTHGGLLNKETINLFKDLKPLELNISLNCSNPEERVFLMGDQHPENVFKALKAVAEAGITFHGSIVALPHIMGRESIKKTIEILIKYGARSIRVFNAGFSKLAGDIADFSFERIYNDLNELIKSIDSKTPVILEPVILSDLRARVVGVIEELPAAQTDLRKGDIIESIDGQRVVSRIAAFIRAEKLKDPVLKVVRNYRRIRFKIPKKKGEKPGFIVHSDISPEKIKTIESSLFKKTGQKTLIISSLLGAKLMKSLLDIIPVPSKEVSVLAVPNGFFGGSIACAGLLTVKDIIKTLECDNGIYETIILPRIMFDIFGNDLTGTSYNIIEEETGIPVEII